MCFRPAAVSLSKTCPGCGQECAITDEVCPGCGSELPDAPNMPATAPGNAGTPTIPGAPGMPKAPGAPGAPQAPKIPPAPGSPTGRE